MEQHQPAGRAPYLPQRSCGRTFWGSVQTYPDVAIVVIFSNGTAAVLLSSASSPCNNKPVGSDVTPTYLANGRVTPIGGNGAAGTHVHWSRVDYNLGNIT